MRATRINAGIAGIGNGLSRDLARFLCSQEWLFGNCADDKPRIHQRLLHIEPLESRHLMDAAGLASLIDPLWFQSASTNDTTAHAGVADWATESTAASSNLQSVVDQTPAQSIYDWIIQFDTASLGGVSSVAQTASLLVGGGVEFQVIQGLGLTGMVLARSSGASLDAVHSWLDSNINVASFERDAVDQVNAVPSDPQYNQLWGMDAINATKAWNVTTGSSSVVVAVIDTGVDYTHVDLAANIWTNPGEIAGNGIDDDGNGFVDDIHGYDFVNNDGNPMDDNSHGTHVSGTIAAVGNNGQGVAGVNWSSSIMALKFLDSNGSGYLSDAIRAVNYATMMRTQYGVNVRVMNNSWGGGNYSAALESAIRVSSNADILFVAAAGNSGTNNDTSPQYPANYSSPNIISVAAVDKNDQLASFSCYGAATVDIAAPGVSIYSTIPGNKYAIYSGTSMATPFVTGVAALAWAIDPNATVAEIRNAILNGADSVASLSGKVASGGVLNAYNTLNLLNTQTPQSPTIGSLVSSSSSVVAGATVTLTAQGITNSAGGVTSVFFALDSNNNGQYDAADLALGSTSTVVNGQASITINTSNLTTGSHRILAKAQNVDMSSSAAVSTMLTVLPADDHGNNAATASAVAAPSSTAGTINTAGDVDWFAFQATAGRAYTFTVGLGTLRDSVLYLYGSNGTKQLAVNDDYGSSSGSQIIWTATTSGTYCLAVAGYGSTTGTYTLGIQTQVQNSAPVLSSIGNQTLSSSQTTLTIPLSATDADGDRLTYSAVVMAVDTLAQKAYTLDQQLNLHTFANGSYYLNARGAQEKYLLGNNNSLYFILPSGALYRYSGSIAKSTLIDTLSVAYYVNPTLLASAQSPTLNTISGESVRVTVSGNILTITRAAGYTGDFSVQVTVSDGAATDTETIKITNSTKVVDSLAQTAYTLDQQLNLHTFANGSFYLNARGAQEKYLLGNNNALYFLLPNGSLYRYSGSIAKSTQIATLSSAYYANPALLHSAQSPSAAAGRMAIRSIEDISAVNDVGIEASASAEMSSPWTTVELAWQAYGDSGRLAHDSSGIVASTSVSGLTASLHDDVLARLSSRDTRVCSDGTSAVSERLGHYITGSRPNIKQASISKLTTVSEEAEAADSELGVWGLDECDAIDRVFAMPTEALLPLVAWLV